MRIAWATDLHLDSVGLTEVERFCADVRQSRATAMLISGDIAESSSLVKWLEFLDSRLKMPIYFVLGNHDYYGSDIKSMQNAMRQLTSERLLYLPQVGPVQLSEKVSLVGHDGWGDCRIGDHESFEILTDYFAIQDLRKTVNHEALQAGEFERENLRKKLGKLGDEAAEKLRPHLINATKKGESVLVLTHVPPFRESCWHNGSISEETWLPGFTCKAVGDLLTSVAQNHPDTSYTVLCGHTHGFGSTRILPNMKVNTGFGDYGLLCFGVVQLKEEQVLVQGPSGPSM